eukprot:CAMPEP_0201901872 /NCGR_PEP_ID=MMETSP0902-20130614/54664_1 /ASSEMBLY_ACC=CAM_ASM_000551 /TAXON_ID=420261 /ORGANISM="Thalassiosira antarctica, Strain CCMP982" /LENGTH=280 /DNA_ID=CAMNT_0048435855 /DNA_START=136 /DNA_END=978 /DNA_ORIENTATION=-
MMNLAILAAIAGSAAAFSPSASIGASSSVLRMSETGTEETTATTQEPVAAAAAPIVVETPFIPAVVAINGWSADAALPMYGLPGAVSPLGFFDPPNGLNGWSADAALPMYGLPGAVSPLGFFDPLGFTKDADLNTVKRLREAEVMHGRVAMMAAVGYLIGESTPTIEYGMDIHHTIANNQLTEVSGAVLFPLFLAINFAEALRASVGWVEPDVGPLFTLREKYYPGDVGLYFGLKPTDANEFVDMQTKELSNGRLAMLAVAGMCVQEQINGQGILENLGF